MRELVAAIERSVAMVRCPDLESKGTALVVSDAGHLVTNNHVVAEMSSVAGQLSCRGSGEIIVRLDGVDHRARLLTDPEDPRCIVFDYALLRLDPPITTVPAPRGPLAEVHRGDEVVCLGYPLDFTQVVVTTGIVASLIRRPSHMDPAHKVDTILTDALIQLGDSGGPMVHVATGRVIGLNTMGHSFPHVRQLEGWLRSPAAQQVPGMVDVISYVLRRSHSGLSYAVAIHHAESDPAFPQVGGT